MPKVAMAWPEGVNRNSGSRVMLPTRVTLLSGTRGLLRSSGGRRGLLAEKAAAGGFAIGQSDQLVADGVVPEAQLALEIVEVARFGQDLEHDVETLRLVIDLVGEAAPAPALCRLDFPALGLHLFVDAADGGVDAGVLRRAVDDDHEFVGSHERVVTSLWTRHRRGPAECGAGFRLKARA